jgi:radical SAM-linked protein
MLVLKFKKDEDLAFIGHLDAGRMIRRTILRAEIKVEYSQGFNPHMLVFLGAPIPLGIESTSEYCTIVTDETVEAFIEKFNNNSPNGLKALTAFEVVKNPNLGHIIKATEYEIECEQIEKHKNQIEELFEQKEIMFEHKTKRFIRQRNLLDFTVKIEIEKNKINCILKSGAVNLKADIFMRALLKRLNLTYEYEIKKTGSYVLENDEHIKLDNYLEKEKTA